MQATTEAFLRRHHMFFEEMPMERLIEACIEDFRLSLAGTGGSFLMLPSYIRSDALPRRNESVLVIDAGGSNLRAGRVHFDDAYRPVVDALKKCRMPGADGVTADVDEMFSRIAAFSLPFAEGCSRAAISFSYPFDSLPSGEGIIRHLCKELQIIGCEGSPICAPLEENLQRLGASGSRRWIALNDTVGSLLGGMASVDRSQYADFIGLILGTGYNTCCCLPSSSIQKDPAARAVGGEMIVNMESGNFRGVLQGDIDLALDAAADIPGDHISEKMVSGAYINPLTRQTLLLAAEEGVLPAACADRLSKVLFKGRNVDAFLLEPFGNNPIGNALGERSSRSLGREICVALLERAARVVAANLCGIMRYRNIADGGRVCVCTDGSTIRFNPVLRPQIETYLQQHSRAKAEFLFLEDATLLGSAWAGLLEP